MCQLNKIDAIRKRTARNIASVQPDHDGEVQMGTFLYILIDHNVSQAIRSKHVPCMLAADPLDP